MTDYQKKSKELLLLFLERLDKAEKQEMLLLSRNWKKVEDNLDELILDLASREILSRNQLYRLSTYKDFLVEAKNQVNLFSVEATQIISDNQLKFAQAGISVTQAELGFLQVKFNNLPVNVIHNFIGISQDGSPLYELLKKSYPETVTQLTDTLLKGISLGYNPRKTARLMKLDMQENLTRALRISRTEQMNVFRNSSLLQMQDAGLKEWQWLAEDDACEYCLSQNGKKFPLNESMDTHPNCRCACLPIV